ncbi:hypothetical protein BDP27DRAFT_1419898 [Rhodocollybia butyracea]|uniref:Uncharacterized protein n=1 Tax=Rhodocollybia butyracea TaxID=206335 RepID=A0A9P5PUY2_9AGAR|nr:hypothetical protein BDP27DRAFT_1419898 [Rhodocollybia butyracea]
MSSSPELSSPFTSWSIPAVLTLAVCVFVFVWFYLKLNRKRSNEKLMAIGSAGIETVQRQNQTRQDRLLFESEQKRILYHAFRRSHAFVQVRDPGRTAESLVKEHTKLVEDIYVKAYLFSSYDFS